MKFVTNSEIVGSNIGRKNIVLATTSADKPIEKRILDFDELKIEMDEEKLISLGAHKTKDGRYIFEGSMGSIRDYFHISYDPIGQH